VEVARKHRQKECVALLEAVTLTYRFGSHIVTSLFFRSFGALLAILILPTSLYAAVLVGKAIHISDGDTLTVLDPDHQKYRVRLLHIDCPEKNQPWGKKAKRALAGLVGNRNISVRWNKRDRYNRL